MKINFANGEAQGLLAWKIDFDYRYGKRSSCMKIDLANDEVQALLAWKFNFANGKVQGPLAWKPSLRMVINYAAHLHEISRMVKYTDPFREKFLWLYGFINGRLEILFMALLRLSITDSRSNVYCSVVRKYFSGAVDGFDEVIYQ